LDGFAMKVLVDTSVWINHLHRTQPELVALLRDTLVVMHPAVIGELACGTIPNRQEFLALWLSLPRVASVSFEEAMGLLEKRTLWKRGLGWTDLQLLASALISRTLLWTLDRRLRHTADQLLVSFKPL
jgi:predicted nucleic acid-binding protein